MVAGPTADDPSTPPDPVGDEFFAPGTGRDESEFWSEAEGGRSAAKRAAGARGPKTPKARTRRPPAGRPPGLRGRLAAAWAAESSARRALRGRPDAATAAARRRRRRIGGAIAGVAALVVALAVGESIVNDGTSTDRAGAEETTLQTGTGTGSSAERTAPAAEDDGYVESAIVDAPTGRTKPSARPKATTTTTAPKPSSATPQSAGSGAGTPSSSGPSGSSGPAGPAPAAPVPTTAAPPPTAPPPPPTTTAPRPAAPTVQSFAAKAASSAGGVCPPLQWATTFTWTTTDASSVAISGLLETTLGNLPGDGSRVVCRLLPAAPLGGWTLTATGPGGSTTATAG